jgi:V8-like Glu-specific endopeptidase
METTDPGTDETAQEIYGGSVATAGQFEAVVGIATLGPPKCTATLINKEFALTAAHCVCYGYPNCDTSATLRFTNVVARARPGSRTTTV